jgi:RimJ/RimL family protein N-acetyltransferase
MLKQPSLSTPRLLLRPFSLEDAPALQKLVGDKRIASTTLNIPHPYEDGMAASWIQTHEPKWLDGQLAVFAITEPSAGLVGATSLRIEYDHKRAEAGYWIGVPFWGRGYASEALIALIDFGFNQLDLNRIHASHLTRNPASGRVMVKAGMKYEGRRRQHFLKWGQFEDVETYGILRSDLTSATLS